MLNTKTMLVAGCGGWGKNLVRNFHELGALRTVCDLNSAVLQQCSLHYPEIGLSSDFNAALGDPLIDKVVIATPAACHYAMVKQALLAGKDVFVEKPLSLNLFEGEELVEIAQETHRVLMVGHLLHYHPHIVHLQALLKEGLLGRLLYITSNRLNLGIVRTEENALWSLAPHDFSVILSLVGGQFPISVRCSGQGYLSPNVVDTTITTMKFADDLRAHVFASWMHPFKEQKLVLVGSQAMLVFDDTQAWNNKLVIYRTSMPAMKRTSGESIILPESEPLRNECEHFLSCCQQRTTPKTDGKEGCKVLQLLQMAQKSLEQDGEAMPFPIQPYFLHPTAHIDPTATVSEGTKIWHYSRVMQHATVGCRCNIGQNVVISPEVVLGNNVKVQNNVSIYTGVICEDDVFLGPSMVFTNVNNPRSSVDRRGQYQKTHVRQGATIGANATILCGLELGRYCFIGAGAVVTKHVKPFALMVGNPARQIGWMSRHGQKLDLPVAVERDRQLEAVCSATGERYFLKGDSLYMQEEP